MLISHVFMLTMFSIFILMSIQYIFISYPSFFRGIFGEFNRKLNNEQQQYLRNLTTLPKFILQFTTKGNEMEVITQNIKTINEYYDKLPKKVKNNLTLEILTEEPRDKEIIKQLILKFDVNVHIVPPTYQTPNRTLLKARALQYMIQKRIDEVGRDIKALENTYIIHLDAESRLYQEALEKIIYTVIMNPTKLVFQGPIYYSSKWFSTNVISRELESLRPWNCYECYTSTLGGTPYHLHGSNLVIRADTQAIIGWDYGKVNGYPLVAEDLIFGLKAFLIFGKQVFGWHGAEIYEQPGLNLIGSVNQRIRWIKGTLQSLEVVPQWREYQVKDKKTKREFSLRIKFKVLLYAMSFIPSLISVFLLIFSTIFVVIQVLSGIFTHEMYNFSVVVAEFYHTMDIPIWMKVISMTGAVLWIFSIQIGLHLNIKHIEISLLGKIFEHIKIFFVSPIGALIETGIAFLVLTKWIFGFRATRWLVTEK